MGIKTYKVCLRRILVAAALAGGLAACAPQYINHGYVPPQEDLDQIVVGVDSRVSVEETIGSPVTSGVINDGGYYYVRSRRRTFGALASKEVEREVVAISFDGAGVVTNIEHFGLERGQVVPLARRVTTTGVSNSNFLRRLLGGLGRFNPAAMAG